MFRVRARAEPSAEDADVDAFAELARRIRALSRRILLVFLLLAPITGAVAVAFAMEDYAGPGGRALGARIGWSFCLAAGAVAALGVGVRKLALRLMVPRWVDEMAARGVEPTGLREAIEALV